MITQKLIQAIKDQYALNWKGTHGVHHWARVYENGHRLAKTTGANEEIISLFSIFHDSRRLTEGKDSNHGTRGAALAEQFRGKYFKLSDEEFELLIIACAEHTNNHSHNYLDITIQTCFDADRLDLARVGNIIDPSRLCTDAARHPDILEWANKNSFWGYVPNIVSKWD